MTKVHGAGQSSGARGAPAMSDRPGSVAAMTSSSAVKAAFRCSECGWRAPKWVGRCGECQAWGSVAEVGTSSRTPQAGPVSASAQPMDQIDLTRSAASPTGIAELDRVLGGGVVPGAVILLAGEPGVGKSTLLLQVVASVAARGVRALYVTGEESVEQVRARAERVGVGEPAVSSSLRSPTSRPWWRTPQEVSPSLLVVDSIQTMTSSGVDGVVSGVTQVREATSALIRLAKERRMACILVGPRDQGRRDRRSPHARAPRRRRAVVRGRPARPAADGPRGQEPLRPHRRGGLLRAGRGGAGRPGRSQRAVRHRPGRAGARDVRHGRPRGPSPAAGRDPGPGRPGGRVGPAADDVGHGRRPDRDGAGRPRAPGVRRRCRAWTPTSRRSAARAWSSRPATSPSPWP